MKRGRRHFTSDDNNEAIASASPNSAVHIEPAAPTASAVRRVLNSVDATYIIECGRAAAVQDVQSLVEQTLPRARLYTDPIATARGAWSAYLDTLKNRAQRSHRAEWNEDEWLSIKEHSQLIFVPAPTRGRGDDAKHVALVCVWHNVPVQNAASPQYEGSIWRNRMVRGIALLNAALGNDNVQRIIAQTRVESPQREHELHATFRSVRNRNAAATLDKWTTIVPASPRHRAVLAALQCGERWCNGSTESIDPLLPDVMESWLHSLQRTFANDIQAALRVHGTDAPLWIDVNDAGDRQVDLLFVVRLIQIIVSAFVSHAPRPPPLPRLAPMAPFASGAAAEFLRLLRQHDALVIDGSASSAPALPADPTPSTLLTQWRAIEQTSVAPVPAEQEAGQRQQPINVDAETETASAMCSVCLTAASTIALIGCGHLCLCHACCREVIRNVQPKCPLCKATVLGMLRVYT